MDRIAKIEAYAKVRNEQEEQEAYNKREHVAKLLNTVRSFAPRMKELMKVGISMYENNVPFDSIFFSNGWSHKVGFIQAYRIDGHIPERTQHLPIGFGIIGGGCCGENLTFNSDGELEWINKPFGKPDEEFSIYQGSRPSEWEQDDFFKDAVSILNESYPLIPWMPNKAGMFHTK